ncbi:MAG: hypothetical protein AB7O59_01865 [Pirellulales bacterium]
MESVADKTCGTKISLEAAKAKGEKLVPRGKKVAVYCPSGTPQSRELILNNLGYAILYDARRQEWGNREGTPVERDAPAGESGSRRNPGPKPELRPATSRRPVMHLGLCRVPR